MRGSALALLLPLAVGPPAAFVACSSAPATAPPDSGPTLADATRPDTSSVPLPSVLASGLDEPQGIVVLGDMLYVAEHAGGRVVAIPRKGGAPSALATGRSGPYRVATDGTVLVVTERDGDDVVELTTGGALTVLASGVAAPSEISVRDGVAYFTSAGADGGPGAVFSVAIGSGSPVKLADGVTRPGGIAVGSQLVYFAADGVQGAAGNVFAVARSPGDAGPPDGAADASSVQVQVATPYVAYGVEADEPAGLVYWGAIKGAGTGGGEGWINRTSLADAATSMIAIAPGGCVDRVRSAGAFVHFKTCSTLMRVPKDGGPEQDLATNTYAGDFAIADGTLYWTDVTAGRVYAIPIPP